MRCHRAFVLATCSLALHAARPAFAETPLPGGSVATSRAADASAEFAAAKAALTSHVEYLAADALGGRGVASAGIDDAADYIVKHWKDAGLEPGGVDGTWFQPFPVPAQKSLDESKASLTIGGIDRPLKLGVDWTPLPYTAVGGAEGPLAFVGYGIDAPEHKYDDYLDIDPSGKIVLMLRYEPRSSDREARFGGEEASLYASFERKAREAAARGAKAVLIVNPPTHPLTVEDALIAFKPWRTRPTYAVPMAQISRNVADELLKAAKMPTLAELQRRLDQTRESHSEDLAGVNISLKTGVSQAEGRNVLGMLRGSGETAETIVVTAHYDHLGQRPADTTKEEPLDTYNGADDNASGTAAIIELARRFANGPRPRRNILFFACSAEELGLVGSRYFVAHPTIRESEIIANVNFDMIGRYREEEFEVSGTGTAKEFPELVKAAGESAGLKFKLLERVRRDSDQAAFDSADIPSLFVHTGLHTEYHRPGDDVALINYDGMVKITAMGEAIVRALANLASGPARIDRAKDAASEPRAAASQPSPQSRVRLGILPDLDAGGPGLLLQSVTEGSAGQKAGLLAGDRILEIAGKPIASLDDLRTILADFDWGDSVEMRVKRGDEEKKLNAKLERPRRMRADPT